MSSYPIRLISLLIALVVVSTTAQAHGHRHHRSHDRKPVHHLAGNNVASFYGWRQHGRRMANGQRFEPLAMTAASRTLPLGARVRVTNLENRRNALVLVTDRLGRRGRAIDLSLGAARHLGIQKQGLARVRIERVS